MYSEPPESLEHISDQAALPNLNSEWVNAKGAYISRTYPRSLEQYRCRVERMLADTYTHHRRLGHSLCPHCSAQNPLRHRSQYLTGDVLDLCQHLLYGRLFSHVSLGERRTIRV